MSKTIRIEPAKLQVAKQCLQSEADSINTLTAGVDSIRETLSGSWEGEAASCAFGVLDIALAAALAVQCEAGAYCNAVQTGVDNLIEADRQRAHDIRMDNRRVCGNAGGKAPGRK